MKSHLFIDRLSLSHAYNSLLRFYTNTKYTNAAVEEVPETGSELECMNKNGGEVSSLHCDNVLFNRARAGHIGEYEIS